MILKISPFNCFLAYSEMIVQKFSKSPHNPENMEGGMEDMINLLNSKGPAPPHILGMLKMKMQLGGGTWELPPPNRPTDTPYDLKRRRKKCKCGYNPHIDNNNNYDDQAENCNVKLALQNHITFPSVEMISDYDEPSMLYYNMGETFEPSRHWATLIEITHDLSDKRPGCSGINQFGERTTAHFFHRKCDTPTTFSWDQLKRGNTLAILYPETKNYFDNSTGIREDHLDSCYIFNTSLAKVQEEAQKLLNHADFESNVNQKELPECFNCGVKGDHLSRCGNCNLAKYCSTECLKKAWKDGHLSLCNQSEVLLRLAALDRYKMQMKYFTFNQQTNFLPPYKPASANKRKPKRK